MSIDTSNVNLLSIIESDVAIKKVASTGGGEWHSPCPFCGGKDRFVVQPNRSGGGRWWCRKCERSGDAINYIIERDGIGFKDAVKQLGLSLSGHSPKIRANRDRPRTESHSKRSTSQKSSASEGKAWQERAKSFIDYCEMNMWVEGTGREYMESRGFDMNTILSYRVGYNPTAIRDQWNGADVWLPRGIVIPYYTYTSTGKPITKIRFRLLGDDKKQKYTQVKGSANSFWSSRGLLEGDYVILCEGEFDAMAAKQALRNPKYVTVATGSTGGSRTVDLISQLSRAGTVSVAFDNDDAGETASEYWLDVLPNARRLRITHPHHDLNDMLIAGINFDKWLSGDVE